MSDIQVPRGNIVHLQKVNDVADWADPEILAITRDYLQLAPGFGGRVWEFAMILMALLRKGKITPTSRGLAVGAGREQLIYAIANNVEHVFATDLYTPDSRWKSVHTDDPQDFVTSDPPIPVEAGKITALVMDMRHLEFADNSFDFVWSTGAIEHIGDDSDFAQHFREVHRVLKPGGVYAFTTAIHYADQTGRIPGNYYFLPQHLIDLIDGSPLHPEPVFDCEMSDNFQNRPMFTMYQDFGLDVVSQFVKSSVIWRRGILSAANSIVLTKDDDRDKAPTQVLGFEATRERFIAGAEEMSALIWGRERDIAFQVRDRRLSTPQMHFGDGTVEISLTAAPPGPRAIVVKQREAIPPFSPSQTRIVLAPTDNPHLYRAQFEADRRFLYSFVVTGEPVQLTNARLRLKRLGADAPEEAPPED